MGSLCFGSSTSIDDAQPRHCTSLVIGFLNLSGENGVPERPLHSEFDYGPHLHLWRIREPSPFDRTVGKWEFACKTGMKNEFKLTVGHDTDSALSRTRICPPVQPSHCCLVEMIAYPERNGSIKHKVIRNIGIKVINCQRIFPDAFDACYRKIGLTASSAKRICRSAPRLVINDPVPHRLTDLVQVHAREMILAFRNIIVGRADLGLKTPFKALS